MSTEINVPGLNINAGVLLRTAKIANERANEDRPERETNVGTDALVAVVFSAFALEAFINELFGLARYFAAGQLQTDAISNFISLVSEAEDPRGSTKLKYNCANEAFTGKSYDAGAAPYQDFELLFRLRDSLVHLKSEEHNFNVDGKLTSSTYPSVKASVESKNILAEIDLGGYAGAAPSWIQYINTRAVARWACNVASEVVLSILDDVPESELKRQAEFFYRQNFRSVT